MTDHDQGQLDTSGAEVYESLFVPSLFGRFANVIADAAELAPTGSVVDVACGTGALTRALRARTTGRVVGVDVNPAMLAVASRDGDDIEYMQGNAANLDFDDDTFDVAVSQFGLMFFDDPSVGIREMTRTANRGTGRFDSIGQWVTTEVRGWTLGDSVSDAQLAELTAKAQDHLARFTTDEGVVFEMTAKVATWKS